MLVRKAVSVSTLFIVVLVSVSAQPFPHTYVQRLKALEGAPYLTMNCARYVEVARGLDVSCGASGLYRGCGGRATVVEQFPSKSFDRSVLRPGDILAFHGIHVVAYTGDEFMDSDALHDGVARIDLDRTNPGDRWYAGPVRVIRWNGANGL